MRKGNFIGPLVLASICLVLSGCYPVKDTYFTPTASIGTTVPNECHQQLGPHGTINIKLDNINLTVTMSQDSGHLTLIVYDIREVEASFGLGQFFVNSKSVAQTIVPRRVIEIDHQAKHLDRNKIVQSADGLKMLSGKTYAFSFDGLPTKDDKFTFSMPLLVIKNKQIEIPVITFTKITEWRIDLVVLNC